MSKLAEILRSGRAPGILKGKDCPLPVQAKALKGLQAIENESLWKHGPPRGASRIARYMGLGSPSDIKKAWERPYRKHRHPEALAIALGWLVAGFCLLGSAQTLEAGSTLGYAAWGTLEPTSVSQVWRGQDFVNRPTGIVPPMKEADFDSKLLRPLSNCQSLSAKLPPHIASLIVALSDEACPTAILFGIALIVVLAVKRHSRWAFAHILAEGCKRLVPFRTNGYAALEVIFPLFDISEVASPSHLNPRPIFSGHTPNSTSVSSASFGPVLVLQKAARLGVAFRQLPLSYLRGLAAIALAIPNGNAVFIHMGKRHYRKTVKFLASYIVSMRFNMAAMILLAMGTCQQECFGGYITPGETLVDNQLVHASDLLNLVGNATIGSGFISGQPINNTPQLSDYVVEYSPTLAGLYKVNLSYFYNNPLAYTSLASGIPNVYTNDLIAFYSAANNAVESITVTNFMGVIASNLPVQNLNFAPTNNPGATNLFALPSWLNWAPYGTNNIPELLAWGTNGVPQQIPITNLVNNIQTTIQTNEIPWLFLQEFTPWKIYGTNTFSPLTSIPPFTNAFGWNTNFPITAYNQTNISGSNLPTLLDTDTFPVNSGQQNTNTSASLVSLYQYMTNKNALPPYTIARVQFSGPPTIETFTNMPSGTDGIITNIPDSVNWTTPTAVSFKGTNGIIQTTPQVTSNVLYWAVSTNAPVFGFRLYTNYNQALVQFNPIVANGTISPATPTSLYWITNYTSVNCGVIQSANGTAADTGIWIIDFITPSATPYYYVSSLSQSSSGTFGFMALPTDAGWQLPTTNGFAIGDHQNGAGWQNSALIHVLIQPQ